MYILGISCFYHDAAACLIKDGEIVAAAEEERFTRVKHDIRFPINAINFCLHKAGITGKDLEYVGFYEKPLLKFERLLSQHIEMFPFSFKAFYQSIPSWINEKLRVHSLIKKKLGYKRKIIFVEHHLAHAASAYLVSPFKESAIFTVDGVGEWTTTALGVAKGNDIELFKHVYFPHSLGLLYSTITAYLGFKVNNDEYKVMGLAPYGKPVYYEKMKKIVDVKDDGSYKLNMDYFTYSYKNRMPSKKLCLLLDGPVRKPEEEITQRHKDVAAALQLVYEDALFKIVNYVYEKTKSENLVIAGGCALNSVANGKILRNSQFKKIWCQPDPGDGGTSIGTAIFVWNSLLNKKRKYVLDNPYLGPKYSDSEIKKFLNENSIKYSEFKNEKEITKSVSKLIFESNVVGWFQGGMEWGPRALGSRSILSNPTNPKMQEILNLVIQGFSHQKSLNNS